MATYARKNHGPHSSGDANSCWQASTRPQKRPFGTSWALKAWRGNGISKWILLFCSHHSSYTFTYHIFSRRIPPMRPFKPSTGKLESVYGSAFRILLPLLQSLLQLIQVCLFPGTTMFCLKRIEISHCQLYQSKFQLTGPYQMWMTQSQFPTGALAGVACFARRWYQAVFTAAWSFSASLDSCRVPVSLWLLNMFDVRLRRLIQSGNNGMYTAEIGPSYLCVGLWFCVQSLQGRPVFFWDQDLRSWDCNRKMMNWF